MALKEQFLVKAGPEEARKHMRLFLVKSKRREMWTKTSVTAKLECDPPLIVTKSTIVNGDL